ncbi:MAG: J domain-containing protein, partial [SAR324 cluster bacterium]|nr:J domain-containing protein [SAR324 cluster bacterium]
EILRKYGLNFRDPLEILVEWARNIYQEITEAVSEQTENSYTKDKDNKKAQTARNRKEPLGDIEAELEHLKREVNSGSKAAISKNVNYIENELEEELRSIKKKYRL